MAFFLRAFSGGRRKGDVLPNSSMCISYFQCLHSTMCEVTSKKPNMAFVHVYCSRTHPQKNLGKRSRLDISRGLFLHFSVPAKVMQLESHPCVLRHI